MSEHHASTPAELESPDRGFCAIVALIVIIAAWLLLFPFVTPIAQTTLNRFHFKTGTFWQWAIQQPIPAMYSFRNTYEVTKTSTETGQPTVTESGTINHFPLRVVTFANGRYRNLLDGQPSTLHVASTYRGHRLESHYDVTPDNHGGFHLLLNDDKADRP